MSTFPVVAIVNTSGDLVEMLKARIEAAGFVVLLLHVAEIRSGLDLDSVLRQHDPRVFVYDVVPPYDRSWRFMDHLRTSPSFEGRRFVLTCANERRLRQVVGTDDTVYEIVGEPSDLDAVVQAVREASRARPTR